MGSVSISILLICLIIPLCVYYICQKKQRKTIDVTTQNQANISDVDGIRNINQSSTSSIYDEIELYDIATTTATHPPSPYTVLTRDPYGYDELYGLQRRIAILTGNSDQNYEEPAQSASTIKAISLPTDLNALVNDDIETIEEEYVDVLPEKLEAPTDGGKSVRNYMERSKSMNDVVKVESRVKSECKRKFSTKNQQKPGNCANMVSVKVQIH